MSSYDPNRRAGVPPYPRGWFDHDIEHTFTENGIDPATGKFGIIRPAGDRWRVAKDKRQFFDGWTHWWRYRNPDDSREEID